MGRLVSALSLTRGTKNTSCPAQQIETLWNKILQKGVSGDVLRDILMFYFQHKLSPPPDPKLYNALLMTFSAKGCTKKMKNVIFHILEEICPYMEDSILETVSASLNSSITVELLNSVYVGGLVPLLDDTVLKKLTRFLEGTYPELNECGKILVFFCQIVSRYPDAVHTDSFLNLNSLMQRSLCTSSGKQQSRGDVDECFTVLTAVNNFNNDQLFSIYTFSVIKEWLQNIKSGNKNVTQLLKTVREYCSAVVEQCFKQKKEVEELQNAVLYEVLDILYHVVRLNPSSASEVLLLVKRIHSQAAEKYKSDYQDIYILVRAMQFVLDFGDLTGYTPQHIYEQFLGDILYHSYSSSSVALEISIFLNDNQDKLSNLLPKFFPNILKLIACHPVSLIEDFIHLIPALVSDSNTGELFCSLIDLPVLSATLCLHQLPAILQLDPSTPETQWNGIMTNIKEPNHQKMYMYMLRKESGKRQHCDSRFLQSYLQILEPVSNHPLLVTCSEVSPLLLDVFLKKAEMVGGPAVLSELMQLILHRISMLYNVPGYFDEVTKVLSKHIHLIVKHCPSVVLDNWLEITNYISILDNSEKSLDLYTNFVWAAGEFGTSSNRDEKSREIIMNIYEAVESTVYELLKQFSSYPVSFKLLSIMCSTVVKLASQHEDLIPRVTLCLSKVRMHISALDPRKHDPRKRKIICQRVDELTSLLQNPTIASNVLLSSLDKDPGEIDIIRILGQFSNL